MIRIDSSESTKYKPVVFMLQMSKIICKKYRWKMSWYCGNILDCLSTTIIQIVIESICKFQMVERKFGRRSSHFYQSGTYKTFSSAQWELSWLLNVLRFQIIRHWILVHSIEMLHTLIWVRDCLKLNVICWWHESTSVSSINP